MTNAEIQALLDKAVAELKLTTVGYVNKHWTVPPVGSKWALGLEYLADAHVALNPPPPTPTLTVESSLVGGQVLSAPVEWKATPSAAVATVDFLIDGVTKWTEHISPYVFNGDGGKLDPSTLPNGPHVFTVVATASDGTKATASANLTVNVTLPPSPPPPTGGSEGRVRFWMYATSQADYLFTGGRPTQADKDFEVAHWDAIEGWLDVEPTYHPNVFRYDDMIAIYTNSSLATQHPEWILKDVNGNKLLFFSAVQYLADPGNPAYQDFKAAECANFIAAKGFKGIKADDVNLDRVTNASAINPRTPGKLYTLPDWQRDMANLMAKVKAKVKAARADAEICHNSLWWASGPDVDRCISQADYFMLERGFNDPNYTPSKILQVWAFVDKLHSMGVGAVHLSEAAGAQAAHFNLGCALLSSNGHDYVYGVGWRPEAWDPVYDKDYGPAVAPRYQVATNVWARDFVKGGVKKTVTADLAARVGTLP